MVDLIDKILGLIQNIINFLGYWGVAGGMLLESACIPIPSELILPLAGNMASKGVITLLGANIAAAIGSMIGSLLAYTVGHYGGRPFILKFGKYFFVSTEHFYKAEKAFIKYGSAAVFFGRFLPVIRTFISLPAGIAKMDIKKFITYSLLGMLPWNFLLIFLGFEFGDKYETIIRPIFKKYEYAVIGLIVLTLVTYIITRLLKKRKKS